MEEKNPPPALTSILCNVLVKTQHFYNIPAFLSMCCV